MMEGLSSFTQLATTWGGGVERVIINLSTELMRRRRTTRVVFPDRVECIGSIERLSSLGIPAEIDQRMFFGHEARSPRRVRAYHDLLRSLDDAPVLLHGNTFHVPLPDVLGAVLARRRLTVFVHHYTELDKISRRRQLLTRASARLASAFVVTTPDAERGMRKMGVTPSKVELIPLGVPEPARQLSKQAARERLRLPTTDFLVMVVTRLDRYKAVHEVLEAVGTVGSRTGQRARLAIVGDGVERAELQRQADRELPGQVQFLGHVSDAELDACYAAGDIFVLPSHDEGFGMVFVEAAMQGVPSIAARVGGVPYAVDHGRTGLLIDAGRTDQLADALQQVMESPELLAELGRAARARAARDLSITQMADGLERVLWGRATATAPRQR